MLIGIATGVVFFILICLLGYTTMVIRDLGDTNSSLESLLEKRAKEYHRDIFTEQERHDKSVQAMKTELEVQGNQIIDMAINNADAETEINSYKALHAEQARTIEKFQIKEKETKQTILDLTYHVGRLKMDVSDLLDPTRTRLSIPELVERCRKDIKAV